MEYKQPRKKVKFAVNLVEYKFIEPLPPAICEHQVLPYQCAQCFEYEFLDLMIEDVKAIENISLQKKRKEKS